jgi:hypothetical protein
MNKDVARTARVLFFRKDCEPPEETAQEQLAREQEEDQIELQHLEWKELNLFYEEVAEHMVELAKVKND